MTLMVAPCSRRAAEHAVTHWHYSAKMPVGRLLAFGAWEDGRYIGAVVFGHGSTPRLLDRYSLKQDEGCELVRVALRDHVAPVSQIVAAVLRRVRVSNPGLKLIVSFADPAHGHHGGIYQAGGWLYIGDTDPVQEIVVKGKSMHGRSMGQLAVDARRRGQLRPGESTFDWVVRCLDPKAYLRTLPGKHRYVMPFTKSLRRQLEAVAQPYPARAA